MANGAIHDDKLKKPSLTMKFLYELIKHNQYENYKLSQKLDQLEQQLNELHKPGTETAATSIHAGIDELEAMENEKEPLPLPIVSLIPRSQRHPAPKKKSIWSYWFRWPTS
jgi:hypothetical protein